MGHVDRGWLRGDLVTRYLSRSLSNRTVARTGLALILALSLSANLTLSTGCASAPPNIGQPATAAFYQHRAQDALTQIRNVAQSAAAQGLVSQQTANDITRWHRAAIVTVHQASAGWRETVITSLQEAVKLLPEAEAKIVRPYVALAVTLLREVN